MDRHRDTQPVAQHAFNLLVFVTKKRTELDSVESLATVSYLSDTAEKLIGSSDTNLLIYDTPQDCLDAVNDKKAALYIRRLLRRQTGNSYQNILPL